MDRIVSPNYFGIPQKTHKKFHQNRWNRLGGVYPQTYAQKKYIYKDKVKSSSLAYKQCETRDKRLLGRNPDRSWCHFYTSVKLFWSQPMSPWTSVAAYECSATQSMDPWAVTKKVYTSVVVAPAPVRVPNQQQLVPSFMLVVG